MKCHTPFEIFFLTSISESYDYFIPSDSCSILLRPLPVHFPRPDHFYYSPLPVIITFALASVTRAQAKTPLWRRRHGSGFSFCPSVQGKHDFYTTGQILGIHEYSYIYISIHLCTRIKPRLYSRDPIVHTCSIQI